MVCVTNRDACLRAPFPLKPRRVPTLVPVRGATGTNALRGRERMTCFLLVIYAEIMVQAGAIGNVEFNHCSRNSNKVAHVIVRKCFNSRSSCNWVDEPLALL